MTCDSRPWPSAARSRRSSSPDPTTDRSADRSADRLIPQVLSNLGVLRNLLSAVPTLTAMDAHENASENSPCAEGQLATPPYAVPRPRPGQRPGHRNTGEAVRRRRNRALGIAAALVVTVTTASAGYAAIAGTEGEAPHPASPHVHAGTVAFPVAGGTATVDTASLRVTARTDRGAAVPVSGAAVGADGFGKPGRVAVHGSRASWSYPAKGLRVTAAGDRGRLLMTVRSEKDGTLAWPVTGEGAARGRGTPRFRSPGVRGSRFRSRTGSGTPGRRGSPAPRTTSPPAPSRCLSGATPRTGTASATSCRKASGPHSDSPQRAGG